MGVVVGFRSGRLLVTADGGKVNGKRMAVTACDCGARDVQIWWPHIQGGYRRSCGCSRKRRNFMQKSHGKTRTAEYRIWGHIKERCFSPTATGYEYYGGRGIRMCDAWASDFTRFWADMGPRPSPKHSIDRIDVNGNYEPGNCRWATIKQQNRNRSNNHLVQHDGKTMTIAELAESSGVNYETMRQRLAHGWTVDRAASTATLGDGRFKSRDVSDIVSVLRQEPTRNDKEIAERFGVHAGIVRRARKLAGLPPWSNAQPVSCFGKTQSLRAWAKEVGISGAAISARLRAGLTPEQALTTAPSKGNNFQSGVR